MASPPSAPTTTPRTGRPSLQQGRPPALSPALLEGLVGDPRWATSTEVARYQFSKALGKTYDGNRDLYDALGYLDEITFDEYFFRFRRGGVASRIVRAYPQATWAGGADIVENPTPEEETPFEKEIVSLGKRLNLWTRILQADTLAGIGRYSVLVIGAPGLLNTELRAVSGPDDIRCLTPVPENRAKILTINGDSPAFAGNENPNARLEINSERFGLPEFYEIKFSKSVTRKVHWSRVIHIAESTLEDRIYGTPRLEACWNLLDDLDKIVGGGSEAAWNRMDPGLHLNYTPRYDESGIPVDIDEGEETKLDQEVENYRHKLSRVIRTHGVELQLLATQVANFNLNVDSILQLLSSTTGIPYRILTGSERGELASTQDRNNWNDRISERRRDFAYGILYELIERFIAIGAVTKPSNWFVAWPDSDVLEEGDKATVARDIAWANRTQAQAGLPPLMSSDEIRDRVYKLAPLSDIALSQSEPVSTPTASKGLMNRRLRR